MKFNLSKSSATSRIRRACPDIRAEDIADLSHERLVALADLMEKKAFGPGGSLGPSWVQVDNYDPYRSSVYTTAVPQFGGGTFDPRRQNFPGGTNNQTNKHRNQDEQTRGTTEDCYPDLKRLRNMEKMRGSPSEEPGFEYLVSFMLRPWDDEAEIKKRMGDGAKSNGKEVSVLVDTFEKAMGMQRGIPGCIVTRKMRREE